MNRIRKMREDWFISAKPFAFNAEALGFEDCFFVLIRTIEHEAVCQAAFLEALNGHEEVQEVNRLAGDIDYILNVRVQVRVHTIYFFYQQLVLDVRIQNVTALRSMKEIKSTRKLPIKTGLRHYPYINLFLFQKRTSRKRASLSALVFVLGN